MTTENQNDDNDIINEIIEFMTAEMLTFGILSRLALNSPDQQWISSLFENEIFSESPLGADHSSIKEGLTAINNWYSQNSSVVDASAIQELKLDHDELFFGLGAKTSPYGSVYLSKEHLLFEEQTIQVRKWFAQYGMRVEQQHKIPDDHIGLEVSFLAHLALLTIRACESENKELLHGLLKDQRNFIVEQPLLWVDEWLARIYTYGNTDLYKGLAKLIAGSLRTVETQLTSFIEEFEK